METIKEEKKAELEQLLNSLIEKGWKPRGYECGEDNGKRIHYHKKRMRFYYAERGYKRGDAYPEKDYKIRELVSKESGLWQFVCENGMVKEQKEEKLIEIYDNLRGRTETVYDDEKYQYRLIETSLKNEDELEQFLLDNIKVDVESN